MSNRRIQFRRGTEANLPAGGSLIGEPRFCTDTGRLYIDDGTNNVSIMLKWQGDYDAGTTYKVNDMVYYSGGAYICTAESTGNLPTDTSYWDVFFTLTLSSPVLTTPQSNDTSADHQYVF